MELRRLEYFCAVARLGSFTRAAEACCVTQSAVSQQVKALEAELGCKLVGRDGRAVRLTPAGECLARGGRDLLDAASALGDKVAGIARNRPCTLRVGYLNRYDGWELAGAVGAFTRRHPDVTLEMRGGSHDAIYGLMVAGEVDMVFNDKRRQFSDSFVNRYLMSCFDYVEVSDASPLACSSRLTARDLVGQTCIIVAPAAQFEVERAYYRSVLNLDCSFVRAEGLEQARFIVAANRGVLPMEARGDKVATGKVIRRIPLVGPDAFGLTNEHIRHDYYAFWPQTSLNPWCEEFACVLQEMFEE